MTSASVSHEYVSLSRRVISRRAPASVLTSIFGITFVVLGGCTTLPRFQPVGEHLSPLISQGACERAMQHRESVQSFRALTEATFSHGSESVSFRYAIVGEEPDKLRIDMLPLEGAFTLGILVSDAGQVTLLNAQDKTYLRSDDEASLLQQFFGLDGLSRDVIIAIVSGAIPPLSCSGVRVTAGDKGLTLLDPRSHTAWTVVSEANPTVTAVTVLDDEDRGVKLDALRQNDVTKVALYDPVTASGEIVLKRVTTNIRLAPALFAVKIPDSYRQVQ